MKKITRVIAVSLLAGALSMTIVGCGTTIDQGNVSSSQSSTQDILSQDPKEVYKKVEDKMQSISSYLVQSEINVELTDEQGNVSNMSVNADMEFEDFYSDSPKLKAVTKMRSPNGLIESTVYILDGYKYVDAIVDTDTNKSVQIKSPVTEEDKEAFKTKTLSSDELDNIKLEKDSQGRVVIVTGLTQGIKDAFKKWITITDATEGSLRMTIDSDYRIVSSEINAKGGSNRKATMNSKSTHSYDPVKIEFPSFEGYVEQKS